MQTGNIQGELSAAIIDPSVKAAAVAIVTARQYRPGEAFLARYSARYTPLYPDIEDLEDRGVDIIALASALDKNGLDADLFGQVMQYRTWDVEETNHYFRAGISCRQFNTAMKQFLEHPRNW